MRLKISVWAYKLLIVLTRAFDFEHVSFVLFVSYVLQFSRRIRSPVKCLKWSFFAKIVNGLKLLIVFANGFGFDVRLGYEFAFEFV